MCVKCEYTIHVDLNHESTIEKRLLDNKIYVWYSNNNNEKWWYNENK